MSIKIKIGEILSKSLQITWKYKVLWIFGILAGCAGGNGTRFNFNSGRGNSGTNADQLPEPFRRFFDLNSAKAAQELAAQYLAIIAIVILLICVISFLLYFLGIMGKTGLIIGASKADTGAEKLSFGELWTESTPHFWRMFGLNVLIGLPFFLLFVILLAGFGFTAFAAFRNGITNVGLGALLVAMIGGFFSVICILSILGMIVGMLVEQAQNAIILDNLGVLAGLGKGWELFKTNALSVIIIAITLGVINWIIGLLVSLPLIIAFLPFLGAIAFAGSTGNILVPLVLGGCCLVILLPIILVVSGILQTYSQSVWTLTYRRLTIPELSL